MQKFTDAKGREWEVSLNIPAIKRMDDAGIHFMALIEGDKEASQKLLNRLCNDVVLICDILYCIVKPQADAAGITDEQFGEAMVDGAIAKGQACLMSEIDSFFLVGGDVVVKQIKKIQETQKLILKKLDLQVEKISPEEMAILALQMLGNSSTKQPENLD